MFGHQRSNTSLFAPASGTQQQSGGTGLFGSSGTSGFGSSTFGQQQFGFGTATSQPQQTTGFGGFGTNTSQPQQTSSFSGFGTSTSQPQQSTLGGFGTSISQPQQTATFGTASSGQNRSSLFSTATSQPQQTSGFGGFGTSTSQPQQSSTFGGFGTTTTSQPQQTSMFGGFGTSANQTSSSSTFGGFGKSQPTTSTATTSAFGTGLFGGAKPTTTTTFGSFTGTSNQQAQQQQKDSLLSLHTAFPDTSVPYFIVSPDKLTRTTIGAGLRNKEADKISQYYTEQPVYLGKRRQNLPGFLTAATAPSTTKKNGQKRSIDSETQSDLGSRQRFKTQATNRGIFGASAVGGFGDSNSSRVGSEDGKDTDAPPVASIWDIGVNPRKYASDLDLPSTSASDVWIASVTRSRTPGKLLLTPGTTPNPPEKIIPEAGQTIVKVYGFPSQLRPKVVEYFAQLGKILERYQSKTNWMTIRYAAVDAAQKALEMHGERITSDCTIGVVMAKSMNE